MKKLLYLLLAIFASLLFAFDNIAKYFLEVIAADMLKTKVEISDVRTDFIDGKVNIDFINVKNTNEFKNKNAFSLNHIDLIVASRDDDLIIIDSLVFDGFVFTLEQNANKVNLVELFKKLENKTNRNSGNTNSNQSVTKPKTTSNTRVAINDLEFINTQIHIDTEFLVDTINMPNIIIRNFGGSTGVPVDQVGIELMRIVLNRVQKEVEKQGLELTEDRIKAGIRKQLESEVKELEGKLGDKAKNWLKKLGL